MQQYSVIIKNDRHKQLQIFQVIFLTVMAIILTIATYFDNNMFNIAWPSLICFCLFLAINQQDFKKKFFRTTNFLSLGFLIATAGSFFMLEWWITLLIAIVTVFQAFIKSRFEVEVNEKSVFIKMFPQKNIEWRSLQNLLIKDDLLTIDYTNNKIMQAEIEPSLSKIGSEKEFNEFCRRQLQAHKQ